MPAMILPDDHAIYFIYKKNVLWIVHINKRMVHFQNATSLATAHGYAGDVPRKQDA
jgi:hypothetical protein